MKGKSCHWKNCKMENCVKEKHEWKTRNGKTGSGMILSMGLEIERRKSTRKGKLRAVRQEIWTKVNHKSRSILKKLGNFSSKKDDEEVK